ncbi:hypothetical protein [Parahaliea mediterranea]|nr:hypothetical protein [Parahaliea mediterranea]
MENTSRIALPGHGPRIFMRIAGHEIAQGIQLIDRLASQRG